MVRVEVLGQFGDRAGDLAVCLGGVLVGQDRVAQLARRGFDRGQRGQSGLVMAGQPGATGALSAGRVVVVRRSTTLGIGGQWLAAPVADDETTPIP